VTAIETTFQQLYWFKLGWISCDRRSTSW